MLSPAESARYDRHIILPQVGEEGQEKLKGASVLLIGAGGLGSPLAMYLAAAGIGRIGVVEYDRVEASNLQRQVMYGESNIGEAKLTAATRRLRDINPHIEIEPHPVQLTSANALDLFAQYDVVADGTDNFPTRYLVNDASVLTQTPNVYGSIFRFEGQVSVFGTPGGPCYRCMFPEPPPPGLVPSCAEGGVLGVLPGMVGTLQATEVIKLILGVGESLIGRLLLVDALPMTFRTLQLERDPACPVCGDAPTVTELIDYEAFCGLKTTSIPEIEAAALQSWRNEPDPPFILDVRQPAEAAAASMGAHRLIPVQELPDRISELDQVKGRSIVVHCRSGARSAKAVEILQDAGFPNVQNLKGGILAWQALSLTNPSRAPGTEH